jgi:hypothetical protein
MLWVPDSNRFFFSSKTVSPLGWSEAYGSCRKRLDLLSQFWNITTAIGQAWQNQVEVIMERIANPPDYGQ